MSEPDLVCEHGRAMDVHCCNCHGGFIFDSADCTCLTMDAHRSGGAYVQLRILKEDLRGSLRSGYLFGHFDEPLDAAGKRIVRVIQQRLSDLPCECTDRTPDGARCRACGGRLE